MSACKESSGGFILACRLTVIGTFISVCGWLFEKVARYIVYGAVGDRGFLTLPLCPIYGISTVFIFLLFGAPDSLDGVVGKHALRFISKRTHEKIRRPVCYAVYFVFVTLFSTLIELLTGLLLRPFGVALWNYSERAFNLLGIICLGYSLLWGILITLMMATLWRPLLRLAKRLNDRITVPLAIVLATLVATDFVECVISLFI